MSVAGDMTVTIEKERHCMDNKEDQEVTVSQQLEETRNGEQEDEKNKRV